MSSKNKIGMDIQKEIENLTERRIRINMEIDTEIGELAAALKALKIPGKAAVVAQPPADRTPRDIAISMLKGSKEICPLDLAVGASIGNQYASQLLTKLVKEKIAKKTGRGVYAKR